jgi:hypothetical protein
MTCAKSHSLGFIQENFSQKIVVKTQNKMLDIFNICSCFIIYSYQKKYTDTNHIWYSLLNADTIFGHNYAVNLSCSLRHPVQFFFFETRQKLCLFD